MIFDLLKQLTEESGVSGREAAVRQRVADLIAPWVDDCTVDPLGNLIARKAGRSGAGRQVMLAAHMDEIGLMVTKLDRGFLRFTRVGGVVVSSLPSQEVIVHGKRDLPGLVVSRPPHVVPAEQRKKPIPLEELFIDVGLPPDELAELVQVGDFVSFRQETVRMNEKFATGKALDNRVLVTVMIETLRLLQPVNHAWDVVAVATTQEERGLRGATTSTFAVNPQIGIALDVTFAEQPGVNGDETVPWDKGPAIAIGPNIHPKLRTMLEDVANRQELPFVHEVLPGATGTDAWAMQITRAGIPTLLVSVPIRNMHSPVETVCLADMERTARLLAAFIASLDDDAPAQFALE